MKKNKKLILKKEKIANLSANEMSNVVGGGNLTKISTDRTFLCCWCTVGESNFDGCIGG